MNNLKILSDDIIGYQNFDSPPLVVVVGNGGVSEEDEKWIKDADFVVRFNNYGTREKITHTKDPLRCDILFSTFDLHSQNARPKHVVIGIPYPFKAEQIDPKPKRWYPNSQLWMVNPYENMNMCKELKIDSLGASHPLPSIGFTAIWHMRNWRVNFYITGFNWYYDEETGLFQRHHLSIKNYPKHWNHNYPKEIIWILNNLRNNPFYIFSDKCNRLLDIAQSQLS